ncbi:MAG: hypothetical protein GF418_14995, partial [Chitinivibrionales bacterium]|nr:hypothetical protein [Chitinivibrionales bacterium]MBD3396927.1 hypothetical protein [Chitinivibrionales bacterium]
PHLCGDRYSLSRRTASFRGMTLSTTREHLLQATVRGIMRPMADMLHECESAVALKPTVFVTGGGATAAAAAYKQDVLFEGKRFEVRKNSSLIGLAKLACE